MADPALPAGNGEQPAPGEAESRCPSGCPDGFCLSYEQGGSVCERAAADEGDAAEPCEWTFHGIGRRVLGDGQTELTLKGWRYTGSEERKAGAAAVISAERPCAIVVAATPREGYVEAGAADEMAKEHCGTPYTAVWQGLGWTVELSSGYPLWTVQG